MRSTITVIRFLLVGVTILLAKVYMSGQVCNEADLIVSNITITTVSGNQFKFTYTVQNTGQGVLYLDRMYFQAYVSQDNVYSSGDAPAGGSIFGNNAPALSTGQTYTGSWTSNPGVSITQYPYLIFQVNVRFGYTMLECSTVNNTYAQYIGCNLAELVVNNINITTVVGNSFDFTYTIQNTGWANLPLHKYYFQAYVSQNSVLDAGDLPAGGSIYSVSPLDLAHNQTYSGNWTSNPRVDLSLYPYLIYQVNELTPGSVAECSKTNNYFVKYIGCVKPDLTISNITINNISGNSFDFTYTIKNTGWGALDVSKFYFQAYVSQNSTYGPGDAPAGGSIFGTNPIILSHNETYSGSWTSNPTVSINTYPYLLFLVNELNSGSVIQCSEKNDRKAKYIFTITKGGFRSSSEESLVSVTSDYNFLVNTDEKSLLVSESSVSGTVNIYKLFTTSGNLVQEGTFTESAKLNIADLLSGLYIFNVTDGSKVRSFKFVIAE